MSSVQLFMITDGIKYIGNSCSGYAVTGKFKSAFKLSQKQIEGVYKRALKIGLIDEFNWKIMPACTQKEIVAQRSSIDINEVLVCVEKSVASCESFAEETMAVLSQRGNDLKSLLSQVDMEIVDIQHAIEFHNYNAAMGYKMYKMLQERLLLRRKIKDELIRIKCICDSSIEDIATGKTRKEIRRLGYLKYKPRVLTELFEKK